MSYYNKDGALGWRQEAPAIQPHSPVIVGLQTQHRIAMYSL
jgi:hypothetical protein